jgi:hypothetical protein
MRFTETGTASFGLTANEAIQLASQLLSAASRACEMNEAAAEAGKEETDEIGQ